MPSASLVYTDPFGTGMRPYLVLHLTGINGAHGDVVGLIDSGADITQLPMGFASLMGYTAAELEPLTVGTAGNPTSVLRAKQACTGIVPGLPQVECTMLPAFCASSPFVLWGRTDVMSMFGVMIEESKQRFALHW